MSPIDYAMALCLLAVVACGPVALVACGVRAWKRIRRQLNRLDFLRAESRWFRNG